MDERGQHQGTALGFRRGVWRRERRRRTRWGRRCCGPTGRVFFAGSNQCGAGHTAIYDSRTGRWKAGPDFPDAVSIADGPAALEPNGNVLMMASPFFAPPSEFFEWDGKHLTQSPALPTRRSIPSYFGNMLVLPTGPDLC